MAAALGSLVVTLGLDAAKFTAGLTKAEYESKKWRDSTLKSAAEVGAVFGATAVAAVAALGYMTKGAIDAADSLNKLTQKTGESAETLSALKFAFELGDVSAEDFATSMGKLAKSMSEGANGSGDQAEAFKALGIAVKNADGSLRPVAAVLDDVAAKFEGFADGPEKTAIAMALFGKSGAALIPTLNAGSTGLKDMADEAKKLGIIIDGDTARAAEEFNDTLTKLGKSSEAVGIRLAKELLPPLQAVTSEMLKSSKETGPLAGGLDSIAATARVAVESLSIFGANVAFVFQGVGREIGAIGAQVASLAVGDIKGFNAISEAVKEDARKARAELDAFERRVLGKELKTYTTGEQQYTSPGYKKPPAPRMGSGAKTGKEAAQTEAERYLEALQKQVEGLRTQSAAEKALADIQAKRLTGITPQLEKQILAQAKLLDQAREEKALKESANQAQAAAASLSTKLADEVAAEAAAIAESNAALREEIAIITGGEQARRALEMARLSSAIALKQDTIAQLQNAEGTEQQVQQLRQQIDMLRERAILLGAKAYAEDTPEFKPPKDEAKETNDVAKELGMTFASAFEEAIVSGNSLRDVLKGLGDDILRLTTRELVTKPLASSLTNWLQQAGGGGGAGGGAGGAGGGFAGWLAGLFGGAGSGASGGGYSGFEFGGLATGGAAAAGGMYQVNERRTPEMLDVNGRQFLLMGNKRGRVNPNPQVGGRGGGVHAPITINMPSGTNAQTANQVGALISRHLMRASARAA